MRDALARLRDQPRRAARCRRDRRARCRTAPGRTRARDRCRRRCCRRSPRRRSGAPPRCRRGRAGAPAAGRPAPRPATRAKSGTRARARAATRLRFRIGPLVARASLDDVALEARPAEDPVGGNGAERQGVERDDPGDRALRRADRHQGVDRGEDAEDVSDEEDQAHACGSLLRPRQRLLGRGAPSAHLSAARHLASSNCASSIALSQSHDSRPALADHFLGPQGRRR